MVAFRPVAKQYIMVERPGGGKLFASWWPGRKEGGRRERWGGGKERGQRERERERERARGQEEKKTKYSPQGSTPFN
jgi:hypothetical protein